jgi:kinesin family protein 5
LGGNSKTSLIITLSPSSYNDAESLSTLRFGMRAKKVKNNAKVNKDMSIQELKHEIDKLNIQCLKYQWRIDKLEEYFKRKGNQIPSDEELENDEKEVKVVSKILNETIKEEENEYLESTLIYCNKNSGKPLLAVDRNKEINECQVYENVVNNKDINEIENIKVKYVEMLYIVNQIEEEKEEYKITLKTLQKEMNERKIYVQDKAYSIQIGGDYSRSMSNMNLTNANIDGSGSYSKAGLCYIGQLSNKHLSYKLKERFCEKDKANSIDESLKSANRNVNSFEKYSKYKRRHVNEIEENQVEHCNDNDFLYSKYTDVISKLYETIEEILIDIEEMKEKESKVQNDLVDMYEIYKEKSNKLMNDIRRLKEKSNEKANNVDTMLDKNIEKSKEEILKKLKEKADCLISSHIKSKPGVSNVIYNKSFITWNLSNFKNRFRNIDANKGYL